MQSSKQLLGIEIGGSKLQLIAAGSSTRILSRQCQRIPRGVNAEQIKECIREALSQWGEASWQAVGVGFGGPVDWRAGRISCSHQVAGWDSMDLRNWLEQLTGAPVALENDSNLGALAEARLGAGMGFNPVFYTNSGSGVGGGLVVDGQIYHGSPPGEAEFGHVRLSPNGPTVEDCCSGWAVDQIIRAHCAREPNGVLAKAVGDSEGGEARRLAEAMEAGDATAQEILKETAAKLAFALSHVVHLFHPSVVVLGGGLSLIGELWRDAVAKALPAHVMKTFQPGPVVRLAMLGEDVVPVGALLLAESLLVAR